MQFAEPFNPGFFRRLQQLKIRTRRSLLGSRQGTHLSQRRGQGLEFADYRPYTAGDDYRHIDWGIYGRTDRLYVREFRAEQDLNVVVILDTSSSMRYPEGQGKFELAKNLALSLGYVALSDGDTVTFALLGKKLTPKFSGQKALSRAMAELREVVPDSKFDFVREIRAALAAQRMPGKAFLISDYLFDIETQVEALDLMRAKNFDITVIQVLAPDELTLNLEVAQLVVDAESGEQIEIALDKGSQREYALALGRHVEALEAYCRRAGISHVLVSSSETLPDIVLNRFPQAGVLK